MNRGINSDLIRARHATWGKRDNGFSPVRSAGSILRAGHARRSRAWLPRPVTEADPEQRGGYGTPDPLEQVLAPEYFAPARGLLRPGELIYVSAAARPDPGQSAPSEAHLALVMVRSDERAPDRCDGSVRLVQDFGRPSDPPAAHALAAPLGPNGAPARLKRGRGRPPGSRNRKSLEGTPAPSP